jgi:RimJ/RimL family protein N-acetyltransferase
MPQRPDLTTRRLWLRPRQEGDVAAMLEMDGDPEVMRFVGDGKVPDPESHGKRLRESIRPLSDDGLGSWSVFRRDRPHEFLGTVGLVPVGGAPEIELVYRFRAAAWGQGYAPEAATPCLAYGFRTLQLPEIVAFVYPDNLRSQRVIAKLGFTPAGRRPIGDADLLFYRLSPESFAAAEGTGTRPDSEPPV